MDFHKLAKRIRLYVKLGSGLTSGLIDLGKRLRMVQSTTGRPLTKPMSDLLRGARGLGAVAPQTSAAVTPASQIQASLAPSTFMGTQAAQRAIMQQQMKDMTRLGLNPRQYGIGKLVASKIGPNVSVGELERFGIPSFV